MRVAHLGFSGGRNEGFLISFCHQFLSPVGMLVAGSWDVKLVQNRCEIRNDSAPDSRGSLRVVAHVAQWIERLPPEQKVVGPIPTVGAQEMAIHNCDLVWRSSRKPQLIPTRSLWLDVRVLWSGLRSRGRRHQGSPTCCRTRWFLAPSHSSTPTRHDFQHGHDQTFLSSTLQCPRTPAAPA
jgi:hypothetical protein